MPLYHYQYVDSLGKKRSGAIEAQGDREAKEKLHEQGLLITRLQAKSKVSKKQNLKGDALLAFTVQLSQLINAGVPLYESLIAIEEQSRGDPYHRVILSLCEQIRSGTSLSASSFLTTKTSTMRFLKNRRADLALKSKNIFRH